MNKLTEEKAETVIRCLVEGASVRSTERITGSHRDTIIRLMVRIGKGCAVLLDEAMRSLPCERIQVDEIWSFVGKKQKNVDLAEYRRTSGAGDVWVFVALDPDTKIVPLHRVGRRGKKLATEFLVDLKSRLSKRVQLSSDALKAYVDGVDEAFGDEIDYGQIVKSFEKDDMKDRHEPIAGEAAIKRRSIIGKPDPRHISTSLIERQNLTMRMSMRRFTRKTNAFSKKLENHKAAVDLHFAYYNFTRPHQTIRVAPATKAGIISQSWSLRKLIDEAEGAYERT